MRHSYSYVLIITVEYCEYPPALLYSQVEVDTVCVGDLVTYMCDEGYMFEDSSKTRSIVCDIGGIWNDLGGGCVKSQVNGE